MKTVLSVASVLLSIGLVAALLVARNTAAENVRLAGIVKEQSRQLEEQDDAIASARRTALRQKKEIDEQTRQIDRLYKVATDKGIMSKR